MSLELEQQPETLNPNLWCQYTSGTWDNEDDAKADLDQRLDRLRDADLFTYYREVCACYVQPRVGTKPCKGFIDRLLVPRRRAIAEGWVYGVVGIECKKSGMKLGPVIAQCLDYGRATYELPESHVDVTPRWVFIWPLTDFAGDAASVMDQHRIGGASGGYCLLKLKTASGNALEVDHQMRVKVGKIRQGNRVGSR